MSEAEFDEKVKQSWDKLSPAERDKYKTEAKTTVVPVSNKPRIIYNALGQDVKVVEAEKEKHKQMEEARKSEIKELVEQACSRGGQAYNVRLRFEVINVSINFRTGFVGFPFHQHNLVLQRL